MKKAEETAASTVGNTASRNTAIPGSATRTYTNKGDLVLDNCLGSGTTAVAAERLSRRWLGMEKEHVYCEIAKRRLEELGNTNGS
ncbi:DNA methyltransferase [Fretibacterium fastidiosum]|uniref:DNA methyltransferase n=1 Tax=Fretibacterium fastidiosum TaxID=651822 RepID=UPI0038FCC07C